MGVESKRGKVEKNETWRASSFLQPLEEMENRHFVTCLQPSGHTFPLSWSELLWYRNNRHAHATPQRFLLQHFLKIAKYKWEKVMR